MFLSPTHYLKSNYLEFDYFQKAMTEQNINLKEVDQEVLGTFSEKKDPNQEVKN